VRHKRGAEFVEEYLSHHGVLGMRWGHRKEGNTSGQSRSERKQSKQAAQADKRLADIISNPKKSKQFKVQLHNEIGPVVQSKWNTITNKPKYVKAAQDGRFKNPNDPISKAYLNEISKAYIDTMNTHLKGFNTVGTKGLTASANSNDFLGFSLTISDRSGVKHADPITMRVNYIKNNDGVVIDSIIDDTLMQAAMFVERFLSN
jgi:hypothetical protein